MEEQTSIENLYQTLLARNQQNLLIIRKYAKHSRKRYKSHLS